MKSKKKKVLVISDGKPGHFNQTLGIAEQIENVDIEFINVDFKIRLYDLFTRIIGFIYRFISFNKSFCRAFLKAFLRKKSFEEIISIEPDIVLSAGSSVAVINILLSRIKGAKSIVCMTPSFIGTDPFDLAVVPEHDMPPKKSNIFKTIGAPNRINDNLLKEETDRWNEILDFDLDKLKSPVVSILLGGSDSFFKMKSDNIVKLIDQVEIFINNYDGRLLITTSRRTPKRVVNMLRTRMSDNERCPLLIIAEEWDENPVPMMIAVSDIILVTEDSVSMISEAVSGNDKVIVVGLENHKNKLPRYFKISKLLKEEGLIDIIEDKNINQGKLEKLMGDIYIKETNNKVLNDAYRVAKEISRRYFNENK